MNASVKEDGTFMNGSFLRFYVHEGHRHHHHLVWEWLMQQANKLGIRGGSAFKAMAGFGTASHAARGHLF
jgi:PII-like signaling protein